MSQLAPSMVPHLDRQPVGVDTDHQAVGSAHPYVSLEMRFWIAVLILLAVGFVMIYSASSAIALRKFGDANYYLKRQALFASVGVLVLIITSRIPYRTYEDVVYWLLLGALTTLALVLVPGIGTEINHARRWFKLGFILVQPGEFAKLFWIIYLSVSLARKQETIRRFSIGFMPHIVLLGLISYLLLREPDFGSCVLLAALTFLMLAVAGVPWRYLLALVPLAAGAFYQLVYRVPYRLERVTAFLNPWTDPLDSGYHLIQAW
ncbi:MAG TPA: stage V sporulation protein E, partial [Syntrophobacteraceae bacterium]|nr:stage V sporulation protein E [Syntrophobacteraceae bacterium]